MKLLELNKNKLKFSTKIKSNRIKLPSLSTKKNFRINYIEFNN